ncbi:Sec-independent protein translocase protein TatB [Bordetella trematum]|uniref:Sec-independent protein translocase protein TatB n=1 Tax=Bordetella trematum TaxID=123899 RepID=UPI000D8280C9|nr:Sec-independent protein translocase protein TatB [Bordetella trematum]SPU48813.1 Sec-independent protein translocase protein TatB [Bordetella trematum]VDH04746.1 Sec-independent protein translocase protein TatB [Bordetella trematum]
MFDVSFTELIVIGVVALVILGPERLPKVARTVGHLLGRAQRYVNDVKSDIQREIELDELRKFKQQMDDAAQDVNQSLRQAGDSVRGDLEAAQRTLDETAAEAKRSIAPPDSEPPPASATAAALPEDTALKPASDPAAHAAPQAASAAGNAPATESRTPPSGNAGNAT